MDQINKETKVNMTLKVLYKYYICPLLKYLDIADIGNMQNKL